MRSCGRAVPAPAVVLLAIIAYRWVGRGTVTDLQLLPMASILLANSNVPLVMGTWCARTWGTAFMLTHASISTASRRDEVREGSLVHRTPSTKLMVFPLISKLFKRTLERNREGHSSQQKAITIATTLHSYLETVGRFTVLLFRVISNL